MSSNVYKLNGAEQKILKNKIIEMKAITRKMIIREDAIAEWSRDIVTLKAQRKAILKYMSKEFGITTLQVINKVLAETRNEK